MLDINVFRETPDLVRNSLKIRQMDPSLVDQVLELDGERRALLSQVENLKAERNTGSKEISKMKDQVERQEKINAMSAIGEKIADLDKKVTAVDDALKNLIMVIPNIPRDDVPYGVDDKDNPVVKVYREPKTFNFTPIPHWDLMPRLGIINFEQGTKITGSRFYVLNGAGARLQRAIIAWMIDLHNRQGYQEKYTPFMVKADVLYASGQLPKFADNLYHDIEEDFWMVPTAEVPLTGIHMGDVLDQAALPLRYTAYTPCFRREKMSAGRDVRGIKRGHQFDKVEMYIYSDPEKSMEELDKMLADARETCDLLGLPYRIIQQCSGDLGFNSMISYDLEVYAPGCGEWLEVSSVSNVGDFQARRANIKYKPADGSKPRFVHTLNGSGLGMPRTLIGVIENNQQPDGSVIIPEVLRPWMGGIEVLKPES